MTQRSRRQYVRSMVSLDVYKRGKKNNNIQYKFQ